MVILIKMQGLQQLPKAQKLFKQYVEYQVEELIKESQNLSAKYLYQREEMVRKQQYNKNTVQQIKKSIRLLDILAKTPFEHRQHIENVRGLQNSQIQSLRQEYQNLLTKYENQYSCHSEVQQEAINESENIEESNLDLNIQESIYSFENKQVQKFKRQVDRSRWMGYFLKIFMYWEFSLQISILILCFRGLAQIVNQLICMDPFPTKHIFSQTIIKQPLKFLFKFQPNCSEIARAIFDIEFEYIELCKTLQRYQFYQMDVTLLYNGPHVQRRKMFTLSPRNNLVSQVEMDWRDSLNHDQLSPISKIKRKQSIQSKAVGERHNSFVDKYLQTNLNLTDSRIRKYKPVDRINSSIGTYSQSLQFKKQSEQNWNQMHDNIEQNSFKLPKISRDQQKKHTLADLIIGKSNNYLSRILHQRLKRYDREP